MNNNDCKKVSAMLSLYIDDKLSNENKTFIEEHFKICPKCFEKYNAMKSVIENLKRSYEKVLKEFEKVETENLFSIKEYEKFSNNLSAYCDNELGYEESVDIRKYLLKSKVARADLTNMYKLQNAMSTAVSECFVKADIDYSKKIVETIKKEHKTKYYPVYTKILLISGLILFSGIGIHHFINNPKNPPSMPLKKHKKLMFVKKLPTALEPKLISYQLFEQFSKHQ